MTMTDTEWHKQWKPNGGNDMKMTEKKQTNE